MEDDEEPEGDEDDVSEDFRPTAFRRARPQSTSATKKAPVRRGRKPAAKARKPAGKPKDAPKRKTVVPSTCECRRCEMCRWTCRCQLKYGPREGQLCNTYFASHRELDFKRHQEAHAVHEWFWCRVMGKLTLEQADWYSQKYKCQPMGLFCPNHAAGWDKTIGDGDCLATFTRRDALIRHLKNHTCHKEWACELTDPANPSKLDAKKVVEESRKRWEFIEPLVKETVAAQAAGKTLTPQQAAMMKSLAKFEHEKDMIMDADGADSDDED
ncbi:hypothetical protein M422DRAFT_252572 [Sphaerobolus stellatus SS14]|uniref:C2H2-type domain-containing protein n=1 Tax=Sphaerobolus stellatus (strain SS14) TaxID=990650 RepID=A0A0C9VYJ4_SPHS4|nr:hypothetical protein M422DRAFT_252572 [Sphaerobolus stellatus SS14]